MLRFSLRRLALAALSVWGVATVVFFMSKLIPGDVARVAAGRTATAEQVEQARQALGLDEPIVVQYWDFLVRGSQGDLGQSAFTHQGVAGDIAAVLPTTVQLVLLSMALTVVIAVPLGAAAALHEGRAGDVAARAIMVIGGGVPVFWLAVMVRWLLGAELGWFPISGTNGFGMAPPDVTGFTVLDSAVFGTPAQLFDSIGHLLLPALALCSPFVASLARNVRSNMMTALKSDYIAFAISKGVPSGRIILRHGLRSALGSTLTLVGMQFGWMISSALLVENVFAIPGVGSYLHLGILNQDTFAVLGAVLVIGVVFIVASMAVDIVQIAADPRIRQAQLGKAA